MSPHLRIAIIGGGPAGLTLGCLLQKRSIPFTIFELRPQPTPSDLSQPAGNLDLHEEDGLAAIRECGLYDSFLTLSGDCTEAQVIASKSGSVIYTDDGGSGGRPEISRNKILQLLLHALPASATKWSHKLLSATPTTDSGRPVVELDFGPNGTHAFDLVVGADGAWSRVRNMLTPVRPTYAGYQLMNLNIRGISTKRPDLAELVGSGTFGCLADRHAVLAQRSVEDSAWIYVVVSTDDVDYARTKGLVGKTPAQAKSVLLGEGSVFGGWGEKIRELVGVACEDEYAAASGERLDIRALHRLPDGHSWEHHPGATLVGDASHLMNPPAGEGVNVAMLDSLKLARAIGEAHEGARDLDEVRSKLDPLVKEFEEDMAKRAMECAEGTKEIDTMMYGSDDGSRAMADWFLSFMPPPEEEKTEN